MASAAAMTRVFDDATSGRSDGVEMKVICLVSLNVGQPIKNATAQLQEPGTTALPSPLFERSRRDQPTSRQFLLVDMLHGPVFSFVTRS